MIDVERLPYRPCVGVMLINREGRVFVGQRADRSEEGVDSTWWQMPQGGLEEGEDPEAGARRELAEETGVTSARFVARTRQADRRRLGGALSRAEADVVRRAIRR